jgi:hypothetical protein
MRLSNISSVHISSVTRYLTVEQRASLKDSAASGGLCINARTDLKEEASDSSARLHAHRQTQYTN